MNKTRRPSDHKSNFKKVSTIPCGFNNNGTIVHVKVYKDLLIMLREN